MLALIGTQGLAILVSGWVDDPDTIERLSVAGSRLAQAYRATLDA